MRKAFSVVVLSLFTSVAHAQELDISLNGHDVNFLNFGSSSSDARLICGEKVETGLGQINIGGVTIPGGGISVLRLPPWGTPLLTSPSITEDGIWVYYNYGSNAPTIEAMIAAHKADIFYSKSEVDCIVAATYYLLDMKAEKERHAVEERLIRADALLPSRIAKDETIKALLAKVTELEDRLDQLGEKNK